LTIFIYPAFYNFSSVKILKEKKDKDEKIIDDSIITADEEYLIVYEYNLDSNYILDKRYRDNYFYLNELHPVHQRNLAELLQQINSTKVIELTKFQFLMFYNIF